MRAPWTTPPPLPDASRSPGVRLRSHPVRPSAAFHYSPSWNPRSFLLSRLAPMHHYGYVRLIRPIPVFGLERVMNLGENRIEMRISRSAWFPRDLCFPHS